MEIEFDCGVTVDNVGMPEMAMRHHLTVCEDDDCRADVQRFLSK